MAYPINTSKFGGHGDTAPITAVAPVITSTLTASGTQNVAFGGYTITASNSPVDYFASNLPAGLSVDTSTGAISGTFTGSGTVNSTIGAHNLAGSGTATLVFTIAAAPTFIGMVSRDASSNVPPYQLTGTGASQLTTDNWPASGVTAYNDALFAKVPGTSRVVALVGSGINTDNSMTQRIISDTTGIGGWTLQAADTSYARSENALTAGTLGGVIYTYMFDDILMKITTGNPVIIPAAMSISTDGGANFAQVSGNADLISGWSSAHGPGFRAYARGALLFLAGAPSSGGANATSKASSDSGATWTAFSSIVACAIEWDVANGVFIRARKAFTSGAYGTSLIIATATSLAGTWTSRQTFTTADTSMATDCTNMRVIGSYVYLLVKLGSGGWTLYRAANGSWQTTNPFTQVHQPGGTTAIASISTPKLFNDGRLRYNIGNTIYSSTDGASWSADANSPASSIGQLTAM